MGKRHKILVAEQTRATSNRLGLLLDKQLFDIQTVTSLADALAAGGVDTPAVMFINTEFGLPGVYRACKELSQRGMAVVLVERTPTKDSDKQAEAYGARALLRFPFDEKQFNETLLRVLDTLALPEGDQAISALTGLDADTDARARIDQTIRKAEELLALPLAVERVIALCSRPETSAADLVTPIGADAALATSIIRQANSVAIGGTHRVRDLQNAVARLGVRATGNVALAQTVFTMFAPQTGTQRGFDRTQYWLHSLGAACCARAVAAHWKQANPEEAFLAGLLHDIGKMVLDEYLQEEYSQVTIGAKQNGVSLRIAESDHFGVSHSFVGGRIAQQWQLPESLYTAIADHHKNEKLGKARANTVIEGGEFVPLSLCTALGNQLAKAFGYGHAADFSVLPEDAWLWMELGGRAPHMPSFFQGIQRELDNFIRSLHLDAHQLSLNQDEPGPQRALVILPEDAPPYGMLLEAFLTRMGYLTNIYPSFEAVQPKQGPFAVGLAVTSGVQALQEAAKTFEGLTPGAIVLSDYDKVERKGNLLTKSVFVARRSLDFDVLKSLLRKLEAKD